jgi:predicted phage tail protein
LSWTAPGSTGGAPIHYVVGQWNAGTKKFDQIATTDATGYTVTGLTNGTTYSFTVWAVNTVGPSAGAAAPVAVTPTDGATIPGIPTGLTGTAGDHQATLSWTAPSYTGGAAVHYLVAQWNATTKAFDQIATTDATSYTVTGLTNGTSYTFTVWAVNKVGPSPGAAAAVTVRPTGPDEPTIPGIPTGMTATPGDRHATLAWTAPAYTGNAPLHYVVAQWNTTTQQFDQIATTDATTYDVTGLVNGRIYTFTVWAVNSVGPSPGAAGPVSVIPEGTVPPL